MKPRVSMLLGLAVCGTVAAATLLTTNNQAYAQGGTLIAPGLILPKMNPKHGKELFATKGCVLCHSVHGVGGTDAPSLDVSTMEPAMSPFDFFAKMWNHAEPMIAMQKEEMGGQLQLTGQDLADLVAFVHNRAQQMTFSENDIPGNIKDMMHEDEDKEGGEHGMGMGSEGGMSGGGMMKGGQ